MDYIQMTLDDWVSVKEQLKKDLLGVQESFVRIGYTLRRIEDQKLYEKDGYASIANFAKAEYGLEESTVSRFISINRKYSIDGYSDRLRPEFAELGSSKLAEMLTLPDGDMEMIRPEATRKSIRELKQFNKATPELGIADDVQELVIRFYERNREILNELYSSEAYITGEIDKLVEIVNPGGNKTFRRGLFILIMYEDNIKIKKIGESPQTMEWSEFFAITQDIFAEAAAGPNTWENYFKGGTDERGEYEKKDSGGGNEDTEGILEDREEREAGHSDTRKDEGRSDEPVKPENDDTSDAGIGDAREDSATAGENGIGAAECLKKQEAEKAEEKVVAPAQKAPETKEKPVPPKPVESTYTTRKVYMESLSEYGMACYIAKIARNTEVTTENLEDIEWLERWLSEKVDEWGVEKEAENE